VTRGPEVQCSRCGRSFEEHEAQRRAHARRECSVSGHQPGEPTKAAAGQFQAGTRFCDRCGEVVDDQQARRTGKEG